MACSSKPTEIVRHEPVIHSISPERSVVYISETITITASVSDEDDEDQLSYKWSASGGSFVSDRNNPTQWQSPNTAGTYMIRLVLSDGYFQTSKEINITAITR